MQGQESLINVLIASVGVLFALTVFLFVRLNALQSRYSEMMTGEQTGKNFEQMLLDHIKKTDQALAEAEELRRENVSIKGLLATGLTRVGIVRFRAFDDMGSDLSFAVALLDASNNGVVVSSLFARDNSRTYAKPIANGKSENYTLIPEEEEAIRLAIKNAYKG